MQENIIEKLTTSIMQAETRRSENTQWYKSFLSDEQNSPFFYENQSSNTDTLFYSPRVCSNECLEIKSFSYYFYGFCKRTIEIYLSSPMLLMILPFILGIAIGFCLNHLLNTKEATTMVKKRKKQSILSYYQRFTAFTSCCILRASWLVEENPEMRDNKARTELKATYHLCESGIEEKFLPRHIAVIMDGNRRYGKNKYGNATRGHWDGSKKLIEFCNWCLAEKIKILTVFAFSTENWSRSVEEVSSLMSIILKYCDELLVEAIKKGIKINVLTTNDEKLPEDVREKLQSISDQTSHLTNLVLNVCLSYGSRAELVGACQNLAIQYNHQVSLSNITINKSRNFFLNETINEESISEQLLTKSLPDPDILLRTSGEMRISNFLLWQCAYSEFFFVPKHWPAFEKKDLLGILRNYATQRKRRYGK